MRTTDVLDLVGIGFGPAGIALAAAIDDLGEAHRADFKRRVAFFEKRTDAGWQTGLLLRNADIQHHYLRDLATPRDPRSRYTFANFLKQHDRIFEFGSLVYGGGGGAVSRIEWSDYVAWAAGLLSDYVSYGCPVETIRVTSIGGRDVLAVGTARGETYARAVAFCAGQDLYYPPVFRAHVGERVFHATEFLPRMKALPGAGPLRFAVVGAGQSAIEVVQYLHSAFPQSRITCVQRSLGFHHGNHSPFIQRMFHPKESDYFFSLPASSRRKVLDEIARANYAAVDREAVSALYRTIYEDNLLAKPRIRMLTGTDVVAVRETGGSYLLDTANSHDGSAETVAADAVILATGFVEQTLPSILEPLRPVLTCDAAGDPEVNYDYSLTTKDPNGPAVFIPGAAEPSHGLGSSSSFSMVALKAERVALALLERGLLAEEPSEPQRV